MSDQLGLLPHSRQEFSSRAYWDDFFVQWKKKGGEAGESFEWYGAWTDIFPVIQRHEITSAAASPRVLVVGCGNSDLSECMYDSGFTNVTSIDFSQIVIDEMIAKTKSKPGMEFLLMDMLNLDLSWTDSFDIVVDKGALDALMGDDDAATADNANKMIAEIGRVLRDGGRYLCVTLAQEHVLTSLIHTMSKATGWDVQVHTFEPADGSALCPFLVDAKLLQSIQSPPPPTTTTTAPTQVDWTVSFHVDANARFCPTFDDVLDRINQQRWMYHSKRELGVLKTGLRAKFNLSPNADKSGKNKIASGARYIVAVVDTDVPSYDAVIPCGVFVVPQGREHEWVFASEESQLDIATSNRISRLIFVAMGRGHEFESISAVQDELSPSMLELFQHGLATDYKVPFLGVGEDRGLGSRVERFRGRSRESGTFVVEDVEVEDETSNKVYTHRRLVFMDNPDAIQSEVRMSSTDASAASVLDVDVRLLQSQMASLSVAAKQLKLQPDHRYIEFSVHQGMVALLSVAPGLLQLNNNTPGGPLRVGLLGLGAGALAQHLGNHWTPPTARGVADTDANRVVEVDAVELDGTVLQIAKDWFGFPESPHMRTHVTDGVKFIQNRASAIAAGNAERFDLVIVDVDNKDLTAPLICPPMSFLQPEWLALVATQVLQPHGALVLNLGSRKQETVQSALRDIRAAGFKEVLMLPLAEVTGDANSVVMAVPSVDASWASLTPAEKLAHMKQAADVRFGAAAVGTNGGTQNEDFLELTEQLYLVDENGVRVKV